MTKYQGRIEDKEQKVTKTNTQYFKFTIDGKFWNCFDAIANQEFKVGDYVEFETTLKTCCKNPAKVRDADWKCVTCGNEYKKFENLIPETMKKVNAPEKNSTDMKAPPRELQSDFQEISIQKTIHENPDSLEIGTPSKGGAIKIYGNFDEPEAFIVKFTNAKK